MLQDPCAEIPGVQQIAFLSSVQSPVFDMISLQIVDTIPIGSSYADLAQVLRETQRFLQGEAATSILIAR